MPFDKLRACLVLDTGANGIIHTVIYATKHYMINIRTVERGDHPWVASLLREQWGSTRFVTRGRLWDAEELPGLIAVRDGNRVGLATYHLQGDECELTTFNSLVERVGVGSALLQSVRDIAVSAGCKRLWLITTNDNTAALRFYQKQGFVLVAVYPNAMEQYRRLKPEIPLVGNDGIPIRDEVELELAL